MAHVNFLTTGNANFSSIGISLDMMKAHVHFWTHCDLSKPNKRADVISSARIANGDYTIPSGRNNKKAFEDASKKALYNKAIEDAKKNNRVKYVDLYKPNKKLVRFSLFGTGLFHNTLFNPLELENLIIDNVNDELNNDSSRLQYITFWTNVDLSKVYKRKRIYHTINAEKTRKRINACNTAIETSDNELFNIPDVKKIIPETTNIHYCDNDFMNYALNNHLAERLVYTKLLALYRGTVNKKTGELTGGNLDALRLLNNVELPTSKEDLIQALNLHLWECASNDEYYMEDDKPIFDIMACFRVIGNIMYASGNKHGKYKLVHNENELENIDTGYLDKSIESINECFWYAFNAFIKRNNYKLSAEKLSYIHDIIGGIISGYRYKNIALYLGISEDACNKYVSRYVKPFLYWYAIDNNLLYKECRETINKKTINQYTKDDIHIIPRFHLIKCASK